MPKIAQSPISAFPGSIVLPDFLILPQVLAWDEMQIRRDEFIVALPKDRKRSFSENKKFLGELDAILLPIAILIVAEWKVERIPEKPTVETFPLTPRMASTKFLGWVLEEIKKIYWDEIEIPNA